MNNAADPKQVEKSRLRESLNDRQFKTDMAVVLESPNGRRVMWWLLERCGVYKSSFTGNSTTFYNEGQRVVGLDLMAKIVEVKPEALLQMMQESKKREEANDDRSS